MTYSSYKYINIFYRISTRNRAIGYHYEEGYNSLLTHQKHIKNLHFTNILLQPAR